MASGRRVSFPWLTLKVQSERPEMQNRRLFPNSVRTEQQIQRQQRAVEKLKQIERLAKYPSQSLSRDLESRSRELARIVSSDSAIFPSGLQEAVRKLVNLTVDKDFSLINRLLTAAEAPGHMVANWFRSPEGRKLLRPIESQVEQSIDLLNRIAAETKEGAAQILVGQRIPDPGTSGRPTSPESPAAGSERREQPGASSTTPDEDRPHRNVRVLPDGRWHVRAAGFDMKLNPDDPLLTAEMLPVASSNVCKIGFQMNFNNPKIGGLVVQYFQKSQRGAGKIPGPSYLYKNAPVSLFQQLRNAPSKGEFIWDHVRERGTIAGTQYEYVLIRAAESYLPRRAMIVNGRQVLRKRKRTAEFKSGRTATLVSSKPNRDVGAYRPSVGRPDRGSGGRPSSGRPDVSR